jgi:hypothetical protein
MQGGIAKCDNCPLLKVICQYKPDEKAHFVEAEKIITDWAAENPELVYPTWRDLFGIMGANIRCDGTVQFQLFAADKPIPTDIAQKLGIDPKEVG